MTQCKAIFECGDDHGDNITTFRCQLEEGHTGLHKESFERDYTVVGLGKDNITITWGMCTKVVDGAYDKRGKEFEEKYGCKECNKKGYDGCEENSYKPWEEVKCPFCDGDGFIGLECDDMMQEDWEKEFSKCTTKTS